MDVRYTLFFLFLFLLGLVRNSANAAEIAAPQMQDVSLDSEISIDFMDIRTLDYDREIVRNNEISKEIVVTFNFDKTTMSNKSDNKKSVDVKLIKKSDAQ